jgi:cell division protein FtsB
MMTETRPPKRRDQVSSLQVMFAAILAIGLLLAINFSSRITAGQPLQEAYERVQVELEQLREEQTALIAERDFAQSDAFVEHWARDDGMMVRSGEVLVVPVPSRNTLNVNQSDIVQPGQIETTPRRPEPWQIWWALFFDSTPPDIE